MKTRGPQYRPPIWNPFLRGVVGLLEESLGMIQGRFRADAYKNYIAYMAVSVNLGGPMFGSLHWDPVILGPYSMPLILGNSGLPIIYHVPLGAHPAESTRGP